MVVDDRDLALAPAGDDDTDALHELFCLPEVYRYLADGFPPGREITRQWIDRSHADRARVPAVGLYLLVDPDRTVLGCVRTHLLAAPRTAELTYVVHPDLWGRGLATAMAWTVMQRAFDSGEIVMVIAGTDDPNKASLAVMKRLGMQFLRDTRNPRWTGVEYARHRRDPPPQPIPRTLPFSL